MAEGELKQWLGLFGFVRCGSGCGSVFVDEPATGAVTLDRLAWPDRGDVSRVVGGSLVDSAVGSMVVVVLDVFLEQSSELVFVPDDCSVQEFMAECSYASLGERVRLRRARRDPDEWSTVRWGWW